MASPTEPRGTIPADLIDLGRLSDWMAGERLGRAPVEDPVLMSGGTQNVLVSFAHAGRRYVLRRPPRHKRSGSDEAMRREARVLAALSGTAIPHPRLVAACPDASVVGAAFYLMEPVDGFNPTVEIPPGYRSSLPWQHRLGLEMAIGIAELSHVDLCRAGLDDLSRAGDWVGRQVSRWRAQLDSYAELPGYQPGQLPAVDAIGAWLDRHRPAGWQRGLVHGDFHLANVMFSHRSPRLAAIVDWELVAAGDPLLDLGHLLATWPGPGVPAVTPVPLPGLPSSDDLVTAYAERSGRDLRDLPWYRVLACYRLAIILEGTHARAGAGQAPAATGDMLHGAAGRLLRRAAGEIRGAG